MANLGVSVTAGLNREKSIAQINADIKQIEKRIDKIKLQITLDKNKSNEALQKEIKKLNETKRQLYVDLKLRKDELKKQYQEIQKESNLALNVDTAKAQKNIAATTNEIRLTREETESLANSLVKAFGNIGIVISAQTAFQLIRRASKEAIEAIKEYDSYITNLSIITNETRERSAKLLSDLTETSFEYKIDVGDVEKATETLLRAGKNTKELQEYLKDTIYLSKLGFQDSADSAKSLVTIGNAYKLEASEMENVVSKLLALDTTTNTVAGELSVAIAKTAQNAQMANLSIDQLAASIAGLKDTTGRTEAELATSINQILARMNNVKLGKYVMELEDGGTEDITQALNDTEKILDTVGIKLRDSKEQFRAVDDVLQEVAEHWNEFNNVQQSAISTTIAGSRHRNTFIAMMENWDRIQQLVTVSAESAGLAVEKYDKYLDSIEAKSQELSTAMKEFWNDLVPDDFVGNMMDAGTAVVQFADKYKLLQTVIKAAVFYGLANGIIKAKSSFAGMVTDVRNVSAAMQLVTTNTGLTEAQIKSLGNMMKGLSSKQQTLILSTKSLSEAERLAILEVTGLNKEEAQLKLQTLGLATAEGTTTTATFSLSGAMKALFTTMAANPVMVLTTLFAGLATVVNAAKQKQEELRQSIADAAEKAQEEIDNISELYLKYRELSEEFKTNKDVKEELSSVTENLLEALGYEKSQIDELTKGYQNLDDAINQATVDSLRQAQDALNVEIGAKWDDLQKQFPNVGVKDVFKVSKLLIPVIDSILKNIETDDFMHIGGRLELEVDTSSIEKIREAYQSYSQIIQEIRENSGLSAEELKNDSTFRGLVAREQELKTAIDEYDSAVKNYNDNVAKQLAITSLLGKEIPKTQEAFEKYKQGLIDSALSSKDFVGSTDEITKAIENVLISMPEFFAKDIEQEVNPNIYVVPSVTTDVQGLKEKLAETQDQIADVFKNTDLFDKAQKALSEGGTLSFTDVSNLIAVDSSLAGKFIQTADGYTIALEDLSEARQKYVDDTQKALQADINNAKAVIRTAEQNIDEITAKRDALLASGINSASDAKKLNEYNEAIKTETQNIEDANEVIDTNTLYLKESQKAYDGTATSVKSFSDLIGEASKKTSLLKTVMSEMADTGHISASTYASLLEQGSEYAKCVEIQNGHLVVNVDKLKDLEAQEYRNAKSANKLRQAELGMMITSNQGKVEQWVYDEINRLERENKAIDEAINTIYNTTPDDKSGSSSDPWKKEAQSKFAELEHLYVMDEITYEKYINRMDSLNQKYYANNEKYLSEYRSYEEKVYAGRKKIAEDFHKDRIEELEDLVDKAKNGEIEGLENKYDYIAGVYDDIIAEIDRRINEILNLGVEGYEDEYKDLLEKRDLYTKKKSKLPQQEKIDNFETEYARREHEVVTGQRAKDEEYYDWLENAAKEAYEGVAGYEDKLLKIEEDIYAARQKLAEKHYNNRISGLEKQIDTAMNDSVDANGNKLSAQEKFDYVRSTYDEIIATINNRINEIVQNGVEGHEDELKELEEQLETYTKKKADVFTDEIEYEIKHIERLQDKYNDFIDEQIDRIEDKKDAIEDAYDAEIDKIDETIKALRDKNDEDKSALDIAQAQLDIEKARQELEKAKQRTRKVFGADGTISYRQDDETIADAQKNLTNAEQKLADLKLDQIIKGLEDQKEALEAEKDTELQKYDDMLKSLNTAKDNAKDYYDKLLEILKEYLDPSNTENLSSVWEKIFGDTANVKVDDTNVNVKGTDINTSDVVFGEINADKVNQVLDTADSTMLDSEKAHDELMRTLYEITKSSLWDKEQSYEDWKNKGWTFIRIKTSQQ